MQSERLAGLLACLHTCMSHTVHIIFYDKQTKSITLCSLTSSAPSCPYARSASARSAFRTSSGKTVPGPSPDVRDREEESVLESGVDCCLAAA